jgi:DNA-binding CsgD family transcriptional regulator
MYGVLNSTMSAYAANQVGDLLQAIPFASCCSNAVNEFVAVNESFCLLYRMRPHDLIGRTPWVLAASCFPEALSAEIQRRVTTEGWWNGAVSNRRADGAALGLHLFALRLQAVVPGEGDGSLGIVVPESYRENLLHFSLSLNATLLTRVAGAGAIHQTPRERQVAELAASGMTSKEIAAHLGISASTVRVHLAAARRSPSHLSIPKHFGG